MGGQSIVGPLLRKHGIHITYEADKLVLYRSNYDMSYTYL